ncbi:MAG: polysaccharide deacetylase family protein [Gammaproteobacteria bacterium]|nr:polysaccharide deacetylase family protein [Gammaproteobacteria bacterium]
MAANGATIANHTHTHAHLLRKREGESKNAWLDRVEEELTTAQTLIEEHVPNAPRMLAYPDGEYDPDVLGVVERLDLVAFGQQSGAIGPKLRFSMLPRFPFGGAYNNLESFKTKVMTLPMPIEPVTANPRVGDDLRPSIELTFTRDDLRLNQLVCYTPGGGTAELERNGRTFTVTTTKDVPVGRSRYNCTMPAVDGRFYWFSQLWIRKTPRGHLVSRTLTPSETSTQGRPGFEGILRRRR